jgi:hypothetical protein
MNKKTTATFAITASLAALVSGCATAGTRGAQVIDEVRPAASAAVLGLAHGRVVVRDDLVSAIEQPFTAAEWRYIRGILPSTAERPFNDEAIRELKSGPPATAERPFSDEAIRELKSGPPATAERPFSDEAIRELKSGPPAILSPHRDGGRSTAPQPDSVDDVLSPLSG